MVFDFSLAGLVGHPLSMGKSTDKMVGLAGLIPEVLVCERRPWHKGKENHQACVLPDAAACAKL
jgi:hypothetical protein